MINSACHDNQAQYYDEKVQQDQTNEYDYIRENYSEIHKHTLERLELKKDDRLLDIGIGTGLLEEKIKIPLRMYGIDISQEMLKKAREKHLDIELQMGSFLHIPYDNGWFTRIVSCFAFHHLSDREKEGALDEMNRVIGDNGLIVLSDFMYEHQTQRTELLEKFEKENRGDMLEEMTDENFTDIRWLKRSMNTRGFDTSYERKSTLSWVVCMRKITIE